MSTRLPGGWSFRLDIIDMIFTVDPSWRYSIQSSPPTRTPLGPSAPQCNGATHHADVWVGVAHLRLTWLKPWSSWSCCPSCGRIRGLMM
jgi:hypothetical protein